MKTWQQSQEHYETWVRDDGIPTAFEEELEDGTVQRVQMLNFGTDDDVQVVARNVSRPALFGFAHCVGRNVANAFFEGELAGWRGELGISVQLFPEKDPEFDLHVRAAPNLPRHHAEEEKLFLMLRTRLRVLESLKTAGDPVTVHFIFAINGGPGHVGDPHGHDLPH
ncbi:MAG: hypothetical protein AB2A00_34945 [Myxococcota bacterium]